MIQPFRNALAVAVMGISRLVPLEAKQTALLPGLVSGFVLCCNPNHVSRHIVALKRQGRIYANRKRLDVQPLAA